MFHTLRDRGMTGEGFVEFLEHVSPLASADCALLFDNAPAHRRAMRIGGVQLPPNQIAKPIPPYSPMLNIVENAISTFKAVLKCELEAERPALLQKTHSERIVQLATMSEIALQAIQPDMAPNWFRHLQSYLPACFLLQDIVM